MNLRSILLASVFVGVMARGAAAQSPCSPGIWNCQPALPGSAAQQTDVVNAWRASLYAPPSVSGNGPLSVQQILNALLAAQVNAALGYTPLGTTGDLSGATVKPPATSVPQTAATIAGVTFLPEQFGAVGTGFPNDDTAALQACANAAASADAYGVCRLRSGAVYYTASGFTIPWNAAMLGGASPFVPANASNPGSSFPQILEGIGATITLFGELGNVTLTRAGVNLAPAQIQDTISNLANYSGTAVTMGSHKWGAKLHDAMILGHAQAVNTNNASDVTIYDIKGDNLAGILVYNSQDWSHIDRVQFNCYLCSTDGTNILSLNSTGIVADGAHATIEVASSASLVSGNTIVIQGFTASAAGIDSRSAITSIPDGSHVVVANALAAGTYAQTGTVYLDSTDRPGPAFESTITEVAFFSEIGSFGYDTSLALIGSGTGNQVDGFDFEAAAIIDPGKVGIVISGGNSGNLIRGGSVCCVPVDVSIDVTSGVFANVIEGAVLRAEQLSGNSTLPTMIFTAGQLMLADSTYPNALVSENTNFVLSATGGTPSTAAWLAGSGFNNTYAVGPMFNDFGGEVVRGPQVGLWVPVGGTYPSEPQFRITASGNIVTTAPLILQAVASFEVTPTINIGTAGVGQITTNVLVVTGADTTGVAGAQIKFINPSATVDGVKYLRIVPNGDMQVLNSNYGSVLLGISEGANQLYNGAGAWLIEELPASTPGGGANFTLLAGGAYPTGTNENGGFMILAGGAVTGNGTSGVSLQAAGGGASGTAALGAVEMVHVAWAGTTIDNPLTLDNGISMSGAAGVSCTGVPGSGAVWTLGVRTVC
jgi:hypothetical protein